MLLCRLRFSLLIDSYLISNGIVYLTIADKSYPRKLAFSYLDELSKEFERSYAGAENSSSLSAQCFR